MNYNSKRQMALEEPRGKEVGKRIIPSSWDEGMALQDSGISLHTLWGKGFPKGVFRFQTYEEANKSWMSVLTGVKNV